MVSRFRSQDRCEKENFTKVEAILRISIMIPMNSFTRCCWLIAMMNVRLSAKTLTDVMSREADRDSNERWELPLSEGSLRIRESEIPGLVPEWWCRWISMQDLLFSVPCSKPCMFCRWSSSLSIQSSAR